MRRSLRARIASVVGVAALAAGFTVALSGVASADSASDGRATFHDGNATTCEDVGFPDSTQVGADGNGSADDDNVSGEVSENAGSIQPGTGEELNVSIASDAVVIDAVVVKGGNGYNVYSDPSVLPPALDPPQHYISPLNGGGNVPAISHWFVCYHTVAALEVTKTVLPPIDETAVVPTSFDVLVSCDDSGDHNVTVAEGSPALITDLTDGETCVVTETSLLPVGAGAPVYDPATANTDGVEVSTGDVVTVGIQNDFTNVQGEQVVRPPAPIAASPTFTG
jgi:hypothetical protein